MGIWTISATAGAGGRETAAALAAAAGVPLLDRAALAPLVHGLDGGGGGPRWSGRPLRVDRAGRCFVQLDVERALRCGGRLRRLLRRVVGEKQEHDEDAGEGRQHGGHDDKSRHHADALAAWALTRKPLTRMRTHIVRSRPANCDIPR